jgi:hypothetical protein
MPKGDGARGARGGDVHPLDVHELVQSPERRTFGRAPVPNRGRGRSTPDDPLQNVAVGLPTSQLAALDAVVTERKRTSRSFNRGALLQEIVAAWLEQNQEK